MRMRMLRSGLLALARACRRGGSFTRPCRALRLDQAPSLAALVLVAFGVGLMGCPMGPGLPFGSPLNRGIPAGLYSGSLSCTQEGQIFFSPEGSETLTDAFSTFVSRPIGPTGERFNVDGSPLASGDFVVADLGPATLDLEVVSVLTSDTTISVTSDVIMVMDLQGESIALSGLRNETLKLTGDGALFLDSSLRVGSSPLEDGAVLIITQTCSGQLFP